MNDLFTCLDCDSIVALDAHGRCAVCGSDAVLRRSLQHLQLVARLYKEAEEIETLEKLWLKS